MAYAINNNMIERLLKERVSTILNNSVVGFQYYESAADITKNVILKLKNKECFGYTLKVKISGLKTDFAEIFNDVLYEAIKDLPRADRIERMRVWRIKDPPCKP